MANEHIQLAIKGMTCNHCASTVNGIIQKQGGKDIHVDYLLGEAVFDIDSEQAMDRIRKNLANAGYEPLTSTKTQSEEGWSLIEKKLAFTLPFSVVLFAHMFLPHDAWLNLPWVQLLLCLPVLGIGLWHFGGSSYQAVRSGTINMDILILIGSTSAFIYSVAGWLLFPAKAHQFLFFETTSTIISLVLLGYVIEHRSVKKTTEALRSLIDLQPAKAKKLVKDGLNDKIEIVAASSLRLGDLLLVNEGDHVPIDGRIIHGTLEVDQSMLTGESDPIAKERDDEVLSGSIIIKGNATLEAVRDEHKSTLARIIELAKDSRKSKPDIQKLADRISTYFVPGVLIVCVSAFFLNVFVLESGFTEAMLRSVAILVIACPCAMGLATPTAVSVGLGNANRRGIVVKEAAVFEILSTCDAVVFDKTGTLTKKEMRFELTLKSDRHNPEEVWTWIYDLETHSSHPLAEALTVAAADKLEGTSNIDEIEEKRGLGMQGKHTDLGMVKIGSARFTGVQDQDSDLYLTINDELIATLTRNEVIKEEAAEVMKDLQKMGKSIYLLSGDKTAKTQAVATSLGIEHFKGDCMPEDKLSFLSELGKKAKVVMIGDGINDAPALGMADVGISIGTASALTADSAPVVLVSHDLRRVPDLFRLSNRVVSTIRQNLFWAFSYNIVAIPLAGLGFLNPMLAALSMAFSDVIVIGNSLRLRLGLPSKD